MVVGVCDGLVALIVGYRMRDEAGMQMTGGW